MNRNKIRVGVIGVGYLGKFHLEKYKMNKSVNLTSIADINNDNLDSIKYSKLYKTNNYEEIVDMVDAVSIVTPTITHYEIAKFFLHCVTYNTHKSYSLTEDK